MELRLLGPVELRVGDVSAPIGRRQVRHVLAALAVDAGRVVPLEALIERVWDDPPGRARGSLQVHVSRLRRLLRLTPGAEGVEVAGRHGGYILELDPTRVDLLAFRRLVLGARDVRDARPSASGDRARLSALRTALDLWQGEPLAGLPGGWAGRLRHRWRQEQAEAMTLWAAAETRAGHPAAAIGPLSELADEHPLSEPVAAALMDVLHHAGHCAEALSRYQAIRARLAEELGTDPGPELQRVHTAVLRGERGAGPARDASLRGGAGGT
jgi:DNA-binding SARP family transcriptional activator